jgi:hypothetical protein
MQIEREDMFRKRSRKSVKFQKSIESVSLFEIVVNSELLVLADEKPERK